MQSQLSLKTKQPKFKATLKELKSEIEGETAMDKISYGRFL